ncbi:MAG: histidinol dehydrogenase [Myxococcales bacterium]|nr:MAG: histidinol dehydrogenase [Myxococcales bacterium]
MTEWLKRATPEQLSQQRLDLVDPKTLQSVSAIMEEVRKGGDEAVRKYALRFGDLQADDALVISRAELEQALKHISANERALLERTAARIQAFADLQRHAIKEVSTRVPGGTAGHSVSPMDSAGCYAPAGRHPLPSSVLMTAITARVAGVKQVWVASPKPSVLTKAAAAIAGADALLAVGGAQAIAALAYGTQSVPRCDAIVGPGNRWVTAAKKLASGQVAIDMLAGPSELVVLADRSSSPQLLAADLLAQAEHDSDAQVILVSLDEAIFDEVNRELGVQLRDLPTAETAKQALSHSFSVLAKDEAQAIEICDALAPEHLQLSVRDPEPYRKKLRHYGALFSGIAGAEVFGDYGAGPNHVLPTSGTARITGGLSVLNFLRVRTWLHLDDTRGVATLAKDATDFARLEGLEAHARAAELRYQNSR